MNSFHLCSAKENVSLSILMDWLEFMLRHRKTFFSSWDMFAVRAISIWKWEAFYDQRFALKRKRAKRKTTFNQCRRGKINSSESSLGFPMFAWGISISRRKQFRTLFRKRVKISEERHWVVMISFVSKFTFSANLSISARAFCWNCGMFQLTSKA